MRYLKNTVKRDPRPFLCSSLHNYLPKDVMPSKIYFNKVRIIGLILCLLYPSGCSLSPPAHTRSQIEKDIIAALKKDADVNATTRIVGKTLYVYIPTEKEILKLTRVTDPEKERKNTPLSFINSSYENKKFTLNYAYKNIPAKGITPSKNITYEFTDHGDYLRRQILQLLFSKAMPDNEEERFHFFVIYIADIIRGIEVKMTINEVDLKEFMLGLVPNFTFGKRMLLKVEGNKKISEDKSDRHIEYNDIFLEDFINELLAMVFYQDINKIGEQNPETQNIEDFILNIFTDIIQHYNFKNYRQVKLHNLFTGKDRIVIPSEIEK